MGLAPRVLMSEGISNGAGKAYFEQACELGLEGIVAKRLDSRYQPGDRSPAWLKVKRFESLACAIIGFVPEGTDDFSSVVIATADEGGPYAQELAAGRVLLDAVAHRSPVGASAAAHAQSPSRAREFAGTLHALNLWLRDLTAVASESEDLVVNAEAVPWLRTVAAALPRAGSAGPDAIAAVEQAASLAAGNVNPQLILADLLPSLRGLLGASTSRG